MTDIARASHARNLVAQIVHDDPDIAEALIKFCALADNATATGAAIRLDALLFAYSMTEHCRSGLEELMKVAA